MGRELKPTHMTVVPVTSQEPPLPSFSPPSFFRLATLGQSQCTPQASLDLLLSCLHAGHLLKLTRKWDTGCWGQEPAELLRNVGSVERQAPLEHTKVGSFHVCWCTYICVPQVVMCAFISLWATCVIHISCSVCQHVCVCTIVSSCSKGTKGLFKGLTLLVSVMAIGVQS